MLLYCTVLKSVDEIKNTRVYVTTAKKEKRHTRAKGPAPGACKWYYRSRTHGTYYTYNDIDADGCDECARSMAEIRWREKTTRPRTGSSRTDCWLSPRPGHEIDDAEAVRERGVGAPGWWCAIRCARTRTRGRADEYICACMCVHALKWEEPVPETGRSRHPASWNRRFPTTPLHRCRVDVVVVFFVGATDASSAHPGALITVHHQRRARSSAVAAAFDPPRLPTGLQRSLVTPSFPPTVVSSARTAGRARRTTPFYA